MPRRAKLFFHRGWWCSNVGGTRTKLAQGRENKSAAEDALLDLLVVATTPAPRQQKS